MNLVKVTVLLRDPRDVLNVPKVIPRLKTRVVKVGNSGCTVKKAGILCILIVQKCFLPHSSPGSLFTCFNSWITRSVLRYANVSLRCSGHFRN